MRRPRVATRESGVDRNLRMLSKIQLSIVATRESGVDRNVLYIDNFHSAVCRHPREWRG